jgi:hypothetical protein
MDNFKPKVSTILTGTHILLLIASLFSIIVFRPPGNHAYLWIVGLLGIIILSFPWSILSGLFLFALHDTENPLFILMLAACAVANTCLIYLLLTQKRSPA